MIGLIIIIIITHSINCIGKKTLKKQQNLDDREARLLFFNKRVCITNIIKKAQKYKNLV